MQREGKSCARSAEVILAGLAIGDPADRNCGLFVKPFAIRKNAKIQWKTRFDTCGNSVHHVLRVGLLLVPGQIGRLGEVFLALLWKRGCVE